ncbi:MAG: CPBP family intramembrane metalloprotease [Ruminococcus sp.]|nr:CPBP family intramembrane metalloprotease [Ruminococcus sp.]
MSLFLSKLPETIIQVILFSLIPFIWWLITARKETNFLKWIGLRKIEDAKKNNTIIWTAAVAAAFLAISFAMLYLVRDTETATSDYSAKGASAIPAVLLYAIVKTALAEEIIFRGFLLKRISAKFDFTVGNIMQSVLFGIMHGIMFFSSVGMVKAIIIVAFTGGIGWFMGFINEKKANGSIIPSWCVHSAANIFSALCSAFSII